MPRPYRPTYHPWPVDPGHRRRAASRAGLRLAYVFVLLAALAFAVVVGGLTGLISQATPSPPPSTATVAPRYVPVPAGPPPSRPAATAGLGGGR
jgi:hypothetical protein